MTQTAKTHQRKKTDNSKKLISINKIEMINDNLPKKEISRPGGFGEFYKHLR